MKKSLQILFAIITVACIFLGCVATVSASEAMTLTFFHFRAEDVALYEQLFEAYKAIEPNVTIEQEAIAGPVFKTTLQTRITSGVASDFFGINDVFIYGNQFNDAGLLMHLNDVEAFSTIGAQFRDVCTDEEGNLFAAVWSCTDFGLFYNADLFEANNVAVPTTWAEFLAACQTFKDNGVRPIVAGGKDAQSLYWILVAIQANDQYAQDPDSFMKINRGEATFSDLPGFKSSLEKFDTLVQNGYLASDLLGLTIADSITLFAQGNAAMLIGGAFHNGTIMGGEPAFSVKAMAIPGDNGEDNLFGVPGMAFGVNENISQEKKAAVLDFLAYLFQADVAKDFSEKSGTFSVLTDVYPEFNNEATQYFMDKAATMVPITMFDPDVVSTMFNNDLYAYLQGLFIGEYTVDEIPTMLDALIY